jgi:hypothetical protein
MKTGRLDLEIDEHLRLGSGTPFAKKWKATLLAYRRQIAAIASGRQPALWGAMSEYNRLHRLVEEAAEHSPLSFRDPAIKDLYNQIVALPKIDVAVDRGREARAAGFRQEPRRISDEDR